MSNNEHTDDILIKQYIEGSTKALSILITRYESRIYGFIYSKIRDKTICNEIFQEAFVKVIDTLQSGHYNEQGKFLSWTLRISHNLVIDHYRRNKKKHTFLKSIEETYNDTLLDEAPSIENKLITTQIQQDLKKLLEKLQPEQKEIIILKMYQNMTYKEIAELKKISINTALGRVRYALINLRKIIAQNQIILTN